MSSSDSNGLPSFKKQIKLRKLTVEQVLRIDEMLDTLGDYGEVHIIVQHGELRYINRVVSVKLDRTDEMDEL